MVNIIAIPSKNFAILALHQKQRNFTPDNLNMTNVAPTHAGVNILLGGAMMSCMLMMVVCICYLCHWRFQKVEESYDRGQSWPVLQQDTPIHVFTLTLDQQCYRGSGLFPDEGDIGGSLPPPDYETVMAASHNPEKQDPDSTDPDPFPDPDLPSYETALKLLAHGYV